MTRRRSRNAFLAAVAAGALGCVCSVLAVTVPQPELVVRMDGDFLRIAAPHLNFLSGKALEKLKDGASVAFVAQLTISTVKNAVVPDARSVARFGLSYDIWEEKFSIAKIGDRPESRRSSARHLSREATENWCLDNLTIDLSNVPADRPFFVQLDLRTEDPRDQLGIVGDPGISISRLIEVFSRQPHGNDHWSLQSGPYRLADLRKAGHG